jgi:AsmA protein
MRKLVIIASVLVSLVLLAVIALPFLLDAERFRPTVQAKLSEALGRQVQIGELHFSLLRGVVRAERITIADDPAFSRSSFVQAKALDLGVELMPLITARALRVRSLTLDEPQVTLLRSSAGKWNFASLGAQHPASPSAKTAPANSSAAVEDWSVQKFSIKNGRLTAGPAAGGARQSYENVSFEAKNVSYTSAFPFVLTAATPGGGKLKAEGTSGPIDRADVSRTPFQAKLDMQNVDLAATGFLDPASGVAGIVDLNSVMRSDGKLLRAEGKAKGDKLQLLQGASPSRQPVEVQYVSDYDLKSQAGGLRQGVVRVGKSAMQLSGNFDARSAKTVLHMKLNARDVAVRDLESLLPALGIVLPPGSSLQNGSVSANLALDGPADQLVTAGPVALSNVNLTGFNLASKMAAVAALAGIKGGSDTLIQSLRSQLRVAPQGIRADDLNLEIPALGSLHGSGTIASNHNLDFRMLAKVDAQRGVLGGLMTAAGLAGRSGEVPFLVRGTTSNPVFLPDVSAAVANTLRPAAGTNNAAPTQNLGDILGGLLGKKKQ